MAVLFFQVLPISLSVGVIYTLYRFQKRKKLHKNSSVRDEIIKILFVVYLTGLINLTLVPSNFWSDIWFYLKHGYIESTANPLFSGSYNLIPVIFKIFTGNFSAGSWVKDMLLGNMLMFIPHGVFVYLLSGKLKTKCIMFIALLIPLSIELLQPIIGRSFDIDDLLLNASGILVGYYLCVLFHTIYLKIKGSAH